MSSRVDLAAWSDALLSDPLARRFADRGLVTLVTPEDVLGQRLIVVGTILEDGTDDAVTRAAPGFTDADRWASLDSFATLALEAAPHLWSSAGWGKVFDLRMPRHVVSPRALSQPYTWHVFAQPHGLEGSLHVGILILDSPDGIHVTDLWCEVGAERIDVDTFTIPYGKTWPDDFDGADDRVEPTLQLLAFLGSPFIPRTRERMGRGARREVARDGSEVDPEEAVAFVLLRRRADNRKPAETELEVEWKHRWLVSGHLRAQWYPSEQAHRLIWIAPYLKGPEGAPMLEHVYKVVR